MKKLPSYKIYGVHGSARSPYLTEVTIRVTNYGPSLYTPLEFYRTPYGELCIIEETQKTNCLHTVCNTAEPEVHAALFEVTQYPIFTKRELLQLRIHRQTDR